MRVVCAAASEKAPSFCRKSHGESPGIAAAAAAAAMNAARDSFKRCPGPACVPREPAAIRGRGADCHEAIEPYGHNAISHMAIMP